VLPLVVACDDDQDDEGAPPRPVQLPFTQVDLPTPPGRDGRIAPRAAVRCDGTWYLVGGVYYTDVDSRPAIWTSPDARTWTSAVLHARDYWARRSVLTSVACRDDDVVVLGGKAGGAHGNPRVSSWFRNADGSFEDVHAGYTLYGGAEATNVSRVASGASDFLITGNRVSGAAVWTSPDGHEFIRNDTDVALSSDGVARTLAIGQAHDGEQWVVVGSAAIRGQVPRVPMAWTSTDSQTWVREEVPTGDGFNDLEQAATLGSDVLAVGLRGDTFGVWRRHDGEWSKDEAFGRVDQSASGSASVSGLVVRDDGSDDPLALTAVSDGDHYALWLHDGEWRPVDLPIAPQAGSERTLALALDGDTLLLIGDDGTQGGVWTATV
jgi:hypothetical protein